MRIKVNKIRLFRADEIVLQKYCIKNLPPMREKMMPDILPNFVR
jgi:hypothetical protein